MGRIRVLVVDDAVVVRRLVTEALGRDPEIEVVGSAPNGRLALAKIEALRPDVVTLDVEMPDMDGIETLAAIRRRDPALPVIMFSTLTSRGAAATLEALANGANDYATKPEGAGGREAAAAHVRDELIPKIKLHARRAEAPRPAGAAVPVPAPPRRSRPPPLPPAVLAIGASTGGPNALEVFVGSLPAEMPVPVLIVQHMPPVFTRMLAERLAARSGRDVREARAGEVLRPGTVRVAPGDHHLQVARVGGHVETRLDQGPKECSCRPAVDVLFGSVAAVYGARTLAVVLTGMGRDGLRGCEAIYEVGGRVAVQDEASSVVWGMPGCVAKAALADRVLPLGELGAWVAGHLTATREGVA